MNTAREHGYSVYTKPECERPFTVPNSGAPTSTSRSRAAPRALSCDFHRTNFTVVLFRHASVTLATTSYD